MKVLLIQTLTAEKDIVSLFPIGLTYIADAVFRKGHDVKIIDPNYLPNRGEGLSIAILKYQPNFIGISIRNADNQSRKKPLFLHKYFKETLKIIKGTLPNVPVAVGGAAFSMFSEQYMTQNRAIDYGIYLEGEESFPELLGSLDHPEIVRGIYYRRQGKVIYTGARPLPEFSNQPFPLRHFVNMNPYRKQRPGIGIQTKRGCPFKCTYCNYPALNGKSWRLRSPSAICDEIEYLIKEFGITKISFTDSILNSPTNHAELIFHEMIKREIKIEWTAYMSLRKLKKEFVALAKKAGCSTMIFSPDGFSQSTLDKLEKHLDEQDIKDAVHLFTTEKEFHALIVGFCFFVTPPGETLWGFIRTIFFIIKTKILLPEKMFLYLNWIRIEPETGVHRVALAEGAITNETELLTEDEDMYARGFYRHPTLDKLGKLVINEQTSFDEPLFNSCFLESFIEVTRRGLMFVKKIKKATLDKTIFEIG